MDRRKFLSTATAAGVAVSPTVVLAQDKPALLGGAPVYKGRWPSWPIIDRREEDELLGALRSRKWYRGFGKYNVERFEAAYAELTGAKHCLATANGTSALLVSLNALGIQAGDEVILPPYTFVATVNVILMMNALPVFVDSDRETSQIDARKIEAAITPRTKLIMPVHLGGSAADMDTILAIARKHGIPVVEDACQAHLGEWRNRKVGTWGTTGCFSFQASKNLTSGEGGAILTNDAAIVEKCYAFHNNSRGRKADGYNFSYSTRGLNLRMPEFQAALLMAQMTRVEAQSQTRGQNAQYLSGLLKEIGGVPPAKMYDGCTRNAYHLYMFRYQPEQFAGLPRAKFIKALGAEGIHCSSGYSPLNTEPFIKQTIEGRGFRMAHPKESIDGWVERTRCPENDKLCEEALWFGQTMLLAPRQNMELIGQAVRKIKKHASELAKV
jgi:dTDP-4-amino-4,6-dideoxygalactose transaminase